MGWGENVRESRNTGAISGRKLQESLCRNEPETLIYSILLSPETIYYLFLKIIIHLAKYFTVPAVFYVLNYPKQIYRKPICII